MASGIPKRSTNLKRKERRAASWKRGQEKKAEQIAEQEANHKRNLRLGTNAKQRAAEARKVEKAVAQLGTDTASLIPAPGDTDGNYDFLNPEDGVLRINGS